MLQIKNKKTQTLLSLTGKISEDRILEKITLLRFLFCKDTKTSLWTVNLFICFVAELIHEKVRAPEKLQNDCFCRDRRKLIIVIRNVTHIMHRLGFKSCSSLLQRSCLSELGLVDLLSAAV